MICAKCGKESKEPLCDGCLASRNNLFDIENFSINFCKLCGKGTELKRRVKSEIKTKNTINDVIVHEKHVGNKIYLEVICKGKMEIDDRIIKKEEKKNILVTVTKKMCDNCIKVSGNYYEAVVQARGEDAEKITKKTHDFLKEKVAAIEKIKEGYDIRITDKKAAALAVRFLREKHSVKESFKLVGKKKGTELYRNFYAVR